MHLAPPTSLQFTSLHFISFHFTALCFTPPDPAQSHATSLQIASLRVSSILDISLHFTSLDLTSFHFTSVYFTALHFSSMYIALHYALCLDIRSHHCTQNRTSLRHASSLCFTFLCGTSHFTSLHMTIPNVLLWYNCLNVASSAISYKPMSFPSGTNSVMILACAHTSILTPLPNPGEGRAQV